MRYSSILLFLLIFITSCNPALNLHVVEKGKLLRSKQLSANQLRKVIKKAGIKTLINLRGTDTDDWWHEERQVTEELGVEFINIGMSARRLPHKQDLITLLDAYKNAPRPILIHCKGGADRTGEASAIYQMEYMGKSKKKALKQLTFKYFHIKQRFPAKRYFIKRYLGEDWVRSQYDPCQPGWKYYDQSKYCHGLSEENQKADDS
jgi:protein tyrosine/serine phosphatase